MMGAGADPSRGCKGTVAPYLENCFGLCCGPGWILNYNLCEKIWQYECIHDKAYFNVLFVSIYLMDIIYENGSFLGAANML